MLRPSLFMICIAVAVGASAAWSGENPWNNRRMYYVIENQGRLVEKGAFIRRTGSYQRIPCVVTEEDRHFYSGRSFTPVRSVQTRTMTTLSGIGLQRTEHSPEANDGEENISIAAGDAVFAASGVYGTGDRVPVPGDVLFEINGDWLASLVGRRDRTFTAMVLDRMTHGVITTDVRILDKEGSSTNPGIWRAEIVAPNRPPVTARFTSDGRLLRLEGGGMVYQVVTREYYDLGRLPIGDMLPEHVDSYPAAEGERPAPGHSPAPVESGSAVPAPRNRAGDIVIPIGESVPAWDNFSWLLLHADPAYEWSNALTTSEYSRIEFNGVSTSITAVRNAPPVDGDTHFPMSISPEIQPYLGSSDAVPSINTAIIEAAYMAVVDQDTKREETNVLKAVSYLAGWIYQTVQLEEWSGYDSSAVTTLSRKAGDSLGQARLFSAMARTLGVPTRICQGFLVKTGHVVNHCWSEAWISGRWVPVDTTVSRVGVPAGYVLAERGLGDGRLHFDFAGFLRTRGLTLTLASAGRETPGGQLATLVVGDRRSYAVSENDWMANLYWGFAMRLPYDWTGQAKLNSVELTSGDRLASVKCEALEGDFRAGKTELDSTVASLRANLSRFKVVESRVVSFDQDGATTALYIDFTCHEDGANLRCRQYVIPRRQRAFRISFWAPANKFNEYTADFDRILASFDF